MYCTKNISSACGKNMQLSLVTWVKTAKGYKIRQASLLAYPDFVICKSFEMCLDILQIRFGLTLSMHVLPFYLKITMNKTTTNKPIYAKKHRVILQQTHIKITPNRLLQ